MVERLDRRGLAAHPAHAHPRAHAARGPGALLRRAHLGDPLDRGRRPARARRGARRERDPPGRRSPATTARCCATMRLTVAGLARRRARDGAHLEAVDLPARERVGQGGAGVLVRAARRRALLAARDRARGAPAAIGCGLVDLDRRSRPSPARPSFRPPSSGFVASVAGDGGWVPLAPARSGALDGVSARLFRISSLSAFSRLRPA